MVRTNQQATSRQAAPRAPAEGGPSKAPAPAPSGRRRWAFRFAALVLSPLVVFGALEGALRLAGYGYPTAFFIPRTIHGQKALIENDKFGWRFFGPALARIPYPMVLPTTKQPGTVRIFVLGESAAYGDPEPDFGLPRMLATLLEDRYPGVHFEVINAAMVAINSNVILPIARECARMDGDIWVIYMGNNEVVGPYGSGTIFGPQRVPSLGLIRSSLALKATRTGELLTGLLQHVGGGGAPAEWRGMMMFVQHQVRPDDPRMTTVYAHFAANLADILRVGTRHGVKLVVSTVASNLKDCAPFASLHRPGLTEAQLQDWDRCYQAGVAAEEAGRPAEAVEQYRQAAQLDDSYADLQFRWARCCLALGQFEQARRHYALARDDDTLRFRADTRINEDIRQSAQNREREGIRFVDAVTAFGQSSPDGLPGANLFYEHVHLNFAGTYLLARSVVEQVDRLLPDAIRQHADTQRSWLTQAECAGRLGWNDWSRYGTLRMLEQNQLSAPPFTYQLNHAGQMQQLHKEIQQLAAAMSPDSLRQAADEYRQATAKAPDDWVAYKNLALLQEKLGDVAGAEKSWAAVTNLLPQNARAYLQLGLLCTEQGRADDAASKFAAAMAADPTYATESFVKLLNETALDLDRLGKFEAAAQLYRQALGFKPDFAEGRINLGAALLALGRTEQAQEQFRLALQHPPSAPQGLVSLGKACASQGWRNEAIDTFTRALQLDPTDANAHLWLGDTLAAVDRFDEARVQYAEAVRLNPDFAEAHSRLGVELGRQGQVAQGMEQLNEAIRLKPGLVEAHFNLGLALLSQQRSQEALRQFQEVLRIAPSNTVAQRYIRTIQAGGSGGD